MKHFLTGHIFLGRMASRTDDEFIACASEKIEPRPTMLRWFCGMGDMPNTFICQLL